jgi:hypothetical protein
MCAVSVASGGQDREGASVTEHREACVADGVSRITAKSSMDSPGGNVVAGSDCTTCRQTWRTICPMRLHGYAEGVFRMHTISSRP